MIHLGQAATMCPKPVAATKADSREFSPKAIGLSPYVCSAPKRSIPHPCPLGLRRTSSLFRGRAAGPEDGAEPPSAPLPTKWKRHYVG